MFGNHDNDDLRDFNAEQPDNADLTPTDNEVTDAEPVEALNLSDALKGQRDRYNEVLQQISALEGEKRALEQAFVSNLRSVDAAAQPKLAGAFAGRADRIAQSGAGVRYDIEIAEAVKESVLADHNAL